MFWSLCRHQLRHTLFSSRFLVALLLVIGFNLPELLGLRAMADHFHEPVHVAFFVFFFANRFRIMIYFVSLALLFAPLPNRNEQQLQLILRVGKRWWLASYLVTVVLTTLIFMICYLVAIEFCLIGHLSISPTWGKILGTLGQQPQFGRPFDLTLHYDYYIQSQLSPWLAIVRQLLLLFSISSLYGLGALLLNLLQDRLGGLFLAGLISIQLLAEYIQEFAFYNLSPLSWVGLVNIANEQNAGLPSLSYIGSCLLGFGLCLVALLCYFLSRHYRIHY